MSLTKVFLALNLLLIGPIAQADIDSTKHELELSLSRFSVESYKREKAHTDTNIYAGYHRAWDYNMQWGFEGGILSVPNGTSNKTAATALAVFTQNFTDAWTVGPFLQLGAGLYPAYDNDKNKIESAFSYFSGIGYRIDFSNRIIYKPYLRIWQRGDERLRYEAQLLNFSFFF